MQDYLSILKKNDQQSYVICSFNFYFPFNIAKASMQEDMDIFGKPFLLSQWRWMYVL